MIIRKRKTTKVITMVTWSTSLQNENGIQFAAMNGSLDASHPLGQTSLTVHNVPLYQENEKAVKAMYAEFVETVSAAAEQFVGLSEKTEGDDQLPDDDSAPAEEEI